MPVRTMAAPCAIHAPVSAGGHNDGTHRLTTVATAGLRHRPRPVGDRDRCAAKHTRAPTPPARGCTLLAQGLGPIRALPW